MSWDAIMLKSCSAYGFIWLSDWIAGCWTGMGGKRLSAVSGVPCLSKEGWRGYWGGYGCWWKAGGICMGSLCVGVSCVSFLSIGC